jgi:hypothetical protein
VFVGQPNVDESKYRRDIGSEKMISENDISTVDVKYHDVDSYQSLLTVMETL